MKKAIKKLVRGDDGRVKIIFIDLETLLPVTDLTGYQVISAGSASEEPQPVASVDTPEVPSQTQTQNQDNPEIKQSGGGGGGALEGRRPVGSFPPAPPAPQTTPQPSTPRLAVEVVRPDGTPVTDPVEVRQTIEDYAAQNPETAATDLLETRLTGNATRNYSLENMEPELRHGLAQMIQAAPPEIGQGLQVFSGYRSPEHQARLYSASAGSGMVAPPGKSNHGAGVAADLYWNGIGFAQAPKEVQDWVHQNAEQFGLRFPMNDPKQHPYEPWHVETISARTGSPFLPPSASTPTPRERPGPFAARPEFPGALPAEDAKPSTFPARPEFRGSLPMKESGPFLARPGLAGSMPVEDARPSTFPGRPGFAGQLPAEDAQPSTFPARPGEVFPNRDNTPFVSGDKEKDRSVAEQLIAEAKTPDMGVNRPEARSFADQSPAYFAAHGLVDRSADQITQIARAFSGELDGAQLMALEAGDPIAQKELANMMVTVENRAQSKMFGSLDKALVPSQYNSLSKSSITNTDFNYKLHGGTVERFVADWYKGTYTDLVDNWENSSYYNPDIVEPTWGSQMTLASNIGDHRFGSLPEYGPNSDFKSQRQSFATYGDREGYGQNTFGTSQSPGSGRSSLDNPTAYADRDGRGSFGTTSSPGYGRSSLNESGGGGALGGTSSGPSPSSPAGGSRAASTGGMTSSKTSSHSTERERDTSLAGRSTSPTNDGYAGKKSPGGGF